MAGNTTETEVTRFEMDNLTVDEVNLLIKLRNKKSEFIERLDIGAEKIEEARRQGRDVSLWEDYWIQMLHTYETVCDRVRDIEAKARRNAER